MANQLHSSLIATRHNVTCIRLAGLHVSVPCRYVFQTDTKYVLNMSGTGHAGMEACIANLVEPGETVLVGVKGVWGARVADLAERYGANVVQMSTNGEGRGFTLQEITQHLDQHKPALLFLCQGESSTGAPQSFCECVVCSQRCR